jgi:mannose-6-phosphate isomerase-like protein (cupin superfamily)
MPEPAAFAMMRLGTEVDAIAPDGSEVRVLCATQRGSMAHFRLLPGAVALAVAHRTVEEIWFVVAGKGRLWRRLDNREDVTELAPGVSVTIPTGAHFQFRNDDEAAALDVVAVTMPVWPGESEADPVAGVWSATIRSDPR